MLVSNQQCSGPTTKLRGRRRRPSATRVVRRQLWDHQGCSIALILGQLLVPPFTVEILVVPPLNVTPADSPRAQIRLTGLPKADGLGVKRLKKCPRHE